MLSFFIHNLSLLLCMESCFMCMIVQKGIIFFGQNVSFLAIVTYYAIIMHVFLSFSLKDNSYIQVSSSIITRFFIINYFLCVNTQIHILQAAMNQSVSSCQFVDINNINLLEIAKFARKKPMLLPNMIHKYGQQYYSKLVKIQT